MKSNRLFNLFEKSLIEKLKEKGASDTSIKLYLSNLLRLNNNVEIKNLNFLKKTTEIKEFISKYKPNTQRSYIIGIVSILKDNLSFKKYYDFYYNLMTNYNKDLKTQNNKDDVNPETWIDQSEIIKTQNNLNDILTVIKNKRYLNEEEYNKLFNLVLLSLYTLQPPRRNIDYQKAYIIKKYSPDLDKDKNYIDLIEEKFIFNNYKTKSSYSTQIQEIKPDLVDILKIYVKYHPLKKDFKLKNFIVPFLVDYNGNELKNINSITRYLNAIFNKKIGVSKLRSIYLTDKYKNKLHELEEDTKAMGTSVNTAEHIYIKQ
jgi:hypothetical protein